ncbi:unnamed protein product [Spirodela intermedia]|uniref:NAC domain-containing protein n=1 Tax=Spirodela intermedia TaxID=51605 RepID=A0A7I8JPQ2_SPIIN|nr:unnamed protein product [Spirodela intermedia]CAA6672159.1 unnamed protein product [Spirodela intermedia]
MNSKLTTGGASEGETHSLPPGFRFHPTDEELLLHYLVHKVSDSGFTGRAIADVDLNRCEPWDLPGKDGGEGVVLLQPAGQEVPTGVRRNRATEAGYWKTTGKDKEIFSGATSLELVGMKKTLKTNWVMHEYRLLPKSTSKNRNDEWVVCRLFKKRSEVKKSPTNQSRLGMTAHAMSLGTKGDQLLHHNIGGIGWTYADLVGLTTGLCGGSSMDCLSRSQWSYAATTAALLPAPSAAQHVPRLPTALPQLHVVRRHAASCRAHRYQCG